MAYLFGDGLDCYATMADPLAGYWDSGIGVGAANTLVAGRFAGSQALSLQNGPIVCLVKSSAVNDAVHHIVMAFRQTAVLSGTTLGLYLQLSDAATNQVCIVFRQDGVVLLTSATPAGTVLATYSGAVTAANTWFAFEFEVVINNTTGRFRARKNGNPTDDFDSGATLNTRPGANAYANKLSVGMNTAVNAQQIDDILWRSDASSVAFVGDVRCYTRMPASDASVQFARSPSPLTQSVSPGTSEAIAASAARYTLYTTTYTGTVGNIVCNLNTGYTGNLKCAIFSNSGGTPAILLATATAAINNPVTGVNTFIFSPALAVTKGAQYWVGFCSDTSAGLWNVLSSASGIRTTAPVYASWPASSPTGLSAGQNTIASSFIVTPTISAEYVNETLQDGTTSYVFDSTVGHADFYNLAPLAVTPASVVAVVTRGFVEKSDAGTRTGAVQIKSGGTTVATSAPALSTSFGWLWRSDVVDPATGSAWTPAGVNAAVIGPTVVS